MDNLPEAIRNLLPYLHTAVLAIFGGTVQYFRKAKESATCSLFDFSVDIISSVFAGLLTYYLCLIAEIDGAHASVLIAISGHMGTRAIDVIETFYERFVGGVKK